MDRGIIYPGQVPLETDLLFAQRAAMIGLSKLAAAMLGTGTIVNGLAVTQTTVASMNVQVAAGEIYQLVNLDTTAYSSLAADTTHQIMKQGVNLDTTNLALTAPGTAGFSINYLIQATISETDNTQVVLPYYNSSNPGTAYSGPAGAGTAQNTRRTCVVSLNAKAGTAATTGSQATPTPDAGYVGLAVVTVANGATTVVNANISAYSGAPVLPAGGLVVGGLQGSAANTAAAAGTADAITAQYQPAITALTNGMTLYVRAGNANVTTTPTFTPGTGIAAKTIVKGNGLALSAGDIAGGGHWVELQYDLTLDRWVLLNPAAGVVANSKIQPVTASVAANALTVGLNQTTLDFRSTTLTSGVPLTRNVPSALSLTVPSGATLGSANGVSSRLALLAIDNAGTVELAIVNLAGGNNLDETLTVSTTAISATANSANVIYSAVARANVAFRVVGFVDISEATAGTWATAPTLVQGVGGQALAALASMGYGQTWQDLTASRAISTTYTNTTGRPIMVNAIVRGTVASSTVQANWTINGVSNIGGFDQVSPANAANGSAAATAIVPPGATYNLAVTQGSLSYWRELR